MSDINKEVEIKATVTADTKGAKEAKDALDEVNKSAKIDGGGNLEQELDKQKTAAKETAEAVSEVKKETQDLIKEKEREAQVVEKTSKKISEKEKKRVTEIRETIAAFDELIKAKERLERQLASSISSGDIDGSMELSSQLGAIQKELDGTARKAAELTGRINPLTKQIEDAQAAFAAAAQSTDQYATSTSSLADEFIKLKDAEAEYEQALLKAQKSGDIDGMIKYSSLLKSTRSDMDMLTASTEKLIGKKRTAASAIDTFNTSGRNATQTATLFNTDIVKTTKSGRSYTTALRGMHSANLSVISSLGGMTKGMRGVTSSLPSMASGFGALGAAAAGAFTAALFAANQFYKVANESKVRKNNALKKLADEAAETKKSINEYRKSLAKTEAQEKFNKYTRESNQALNNQRKRLQDNLSALEEYIAAAEKAALAKIDLELAKIENDPNKTEKEKSLARIESERQKRELKKENEGTINREKIKQLEENVRIAEKEADNARKEAESKEGSLKKLEELSGNASRFSDILGEIQKRGGLEGGENLVKDATKWLSNAVMGGDKWGEQLKEEFERLKPYYEGYNKVLKDYGASSIQEMKERVKEAQENLEKIKQSVKEAESAKSRWESTQRERDAENKAIEEKANIEEAAEKRKIAQQEEIEKLTKELEKVNSQLEKEQNRDGSLTLSGNLNKVLEAFNKNISAKSEASKKKFDDEKSKQTIDGLVNYLTKNGQDGIDQKEGDFIRSEIKRIKNDKSRKNGESLAKELEEIFKLAQQNNTTNKSLFKSIYEARKKQEELEKQIKDLEEGKSPEEKQPELNTPNKPTIQPEKTTTDAEQFAARIEELRSIFSDNFVDTNEAAAIPQILESLKQLSLDNKERESVLSQVLQGIRENIPNLAGDTTQTTRLISIAQTLSEKVTSEAAARKSADDVVNRRITNLETQVKRGQK